MGIIHAEIEIINGDDMVLARRSVIGEEEIRRMFLTVLVDTGAINMCINENIQEYMQFPLSELRKFTVATGEEKELPVVSNVEIRFGNRSTTCRAIVLPGDSEVLLGAIPLEDLDVVINSRRQELVINPESPDMAMMRLNYHRSTEKIVI